MKNPPTLRGRSDPVFDRLGQSPNKERLSDYLALLKSLDDQGRYLPFDALRYRWAPGLDSNLCWALVKKARTAQYLKLLPLGEPPRWLQFVLTPQAQKAISAVDRQTTTAVLEYMTGQIGERAHFSYLLNDLIEDEAISSSQLEGAATTTRVAKDMLKFHRLPRTVDERMVIGNFEMMNFAWEQRYEPLSVELIAQMHRVGVEGIDDARYSPGAFRRNDDVVVQDGEGNTVHTPPPAVGLVSRLQVLVEWINQLHASPHQTDYLHPLIKGVALHFALGYEHPFRDGNGRVARALFYWFMFKNDFSAFRYIAISILLRKAPVKYGRSYLDTEADDLDLTYFIDFQCSIVLRAVDRFTEAYRKSLIDAEQFDLWLRESGFLDQLSEKQRALFQVAKSGMAKEFTVNNVKENLGCSYNTASATLNGLVALKLFEKRKMGREWVYFLRSVSVS
ncbi:Fic family protein [Pseudomonas azerbaijanoccidens]|uniref:Fic family protein n=1 Tax=Pseudomonas azerbaijanoccidentalis TaxID=2842347 RepID=UPI00200AD330|nr:Fic family protein [Pseudomonas azerbaijanoccidentalis]MCK8668161.1 Fic family protein [Pseudomonas azerbaijanoccidentalis]